MSRDINQCSPLLFISRGEMITMLLTKKVKIKWRGATKKHYEEKGYTFTKIGDEFEAEIEDLLGTPDTTVNVKCDYCNSEYTMKYRKYVERVLNGTIKKCACKKCRHQKTAESNYEKYGCTNPMQVKAISDKSRNKLKTPVSVVRDKYVELNFTPLFTDEEYNTSLSGKLKCTCNNHPTIVQYKDYHGIMSGKGCKYCRNDFQKGENHYNWQGGEGSIVHYLRHCPEVKYWKYDSLKNGNFKCYLSGEVKDLEVHHQKIPFREIVEMAHKELNIDFKKLKTDYSDTELEDIKRKMLKIHYGAGYGVPLTAELHKLFHKIYGCINNTSEQFHEFCFTYWHGDLQELTKDNYKELLVKFL